MTGALKGLGLALLFHGRRLSAKHLGNSGS
jgi:hypothetical protein